MISGYLNLVKYPIYHPSAWVSFETVSVWQIYIWLLCVFPGVGKDLRKFKSRTLCLALLYIKQTAKRGFWFCLFRFCVGLFLGCVGWMYSPGYDLKRVVNLIFNSSSFFFVPLGLLQTTTEGTYLIFRPPQNFWPKQYCTLNNVPSSHQSTQLWVIDFLNNSWSL